MRALSAFALAVLLAVAPGETVPAEVSPADLERLERSLRLHEDEIERQRERLDRQGRELERLRREREAGEPASAAEEAALPQLPGIWKPHGDTQLSLGRRQVSIR